MKTLRKCLLMFLVLSPAVVMAQATPQKDANIRNILENEESSDIVIQQKGDKLDMSTPLSSLVFLKKALDEEDFAVAGTFLDMRYLPPEVAELDTRDLLLQLRYVWGRQEILDINTISDNVEGHRGDGLPDYRDQIGTIETSDGAVPVYMQRVPDGKGGRVWKISNATVANIPEMWEELGYSAGTQYLADILPSFRIMALENWQVAIILAMFVFGWLGATLLSLGLEKLLVRRSGPFMDAISRFLRLQFRIFSFFMILRLGVAELGLSRYSMVVLQSSGLIYIGIMVLLMGLINLTKGYQTRRLTDAGNEHYVALLKPLSTVTKIVVVIIIGLIWAKNAGYDMSTVLAGLGVGSLAVALAAQKTLENIIGAITIYSARPIKPGDFCRFGTTVGTVEEIGLRSTMIRTLNRTLVSIPNAVFAADEVENFSERDRIRYFRYLRLEIADIDTLNRLLEQLRDTFHNTESVRADTISIRLDEIIDNTVHIRVDAGIATQDYQEFLKVAEQLNLAIIGLVATSNIRFSGPGQLLHLTHAGDDDKDPVEKVMQQAEPEPN
ncbi:mechanosensitive ion channel [Halieaceae bacterium IMCC14734]|uniref:Mechanosensitive ion channel n=1 Tax=Candidatus Litorirhabdus singularis TaxID=2518993 RepID=A0ABT3TBS6_9GAMM|nr:mechanosensitive ion channel domain-containing protein [Candidatus Litorirhabdus singularis]MCX2979713.1 mechanosensitive ion channel [Candidatus Litorirhabdus singularis]